MKRTYTGKFIGGGGQIRVKEPDSEFTLGPHHRRRRQCDDQSWIIPRITANNFIGL